ncbi:Hypothetical predicted protein [Marmota monax]|uniref:Uncharacterized protein n=1 Tax=Marmota monax TaxID=9995 RepID=A0A5E4B8B7_MARMO|nr:hypothetical protein GHT09_010663 [Marmota monax]VTJ65250.1 Hypothetical predicted protein [Marmota monax]
MRASRTPGGKLPGLRFLAGSDVSLCKETWQGARFGAPRPAGLCELQRNVMDGGRGREKLVGWWGYGQLPSVSTPTVEVQCPAVSGGQYAEHLWPQCEKVLRE